MSAAAPRPLADRLRPTALGEVLGQDHLVGPEGTLTRLLRSRSRALDHPLGTAGRGQDDGGAPAGRRDGPRVRAAVGDLFRRAGPTQGLRARGGAACDGARYASVHRRDPPFQQIAAGQLSAAYGGRHDHAGGGDDGEPVVRAERSRTLARLSPGVSSPGSGGDRDLARSRRGAGGAHAAARGGRARGAGGDGRW